MIEYAVLAIGGIAIAFGLWGFGRGLRDKPDQPKGGDERSTGAMWADDVSGSRN